MSKAVLTDHEFDIDRYVVLLSKAQGGRTQTEFANDCGLSTAYICKHLNKRINKSPIPSTLKKIAAVASNGVTYKDLLDAAGYDASKYIDKAELSNDRDLRVHALEFDKLAKLTITETLSKSKYQWSIKGSSSLYVSYDLDVELHDHTINHWYFRFISSDMDEHMTEDKSQFKRLLRYYGYLTLMSAGTNVMYSFVTESQIIFDLIKENAPLAIAMHISVILIDTSSLTIIKEEVLESAVSVNHDHTDLLFLN